MCNHKKWHAGKMIDLVGGDGEQIWQEGFMEDTIELVGVDYKQCNQCGEKFVPEGICATDIKRKEDGTRVTAVYGR